MGHVFLMRCSKNYCWLKTHINEFIIETRLVIVVVFLRSNYTNITILIFNGITVNNKGLYIFKILTYNCKYMWVL